MAETLQRVGDRDAEPPGEMVVAGAGRRERRVDAAQPRIGRVGFAADDRHRLEHLRDERRGEAVVAVPALRLDGDEAAVEELREMAARGRRGDAGEEGELLRGPRPSVHEREKDARAGGIADDRGNPGEVEFRAHAGKLSRT